MDVLLLEDGSNQVRKFFRGGRWKPKVNHLSVTAWERTVFIKMGTGRDLMTCKLLPKTDYDFSRNDKISTSCLADSNQKSKSNLSEVPRMIFNCLPNMTNI